MRGSTFTALCSLLTAAYATPFPAAAPAAEAAPAATAEAPSPVLERAAEITGNPFNAGPLFVNSFYASEVSASAIPALSRTRASLLPAASAAARVPSFYWMDTADKVPQIATFVTNARAAKQKVVQLVVYDLPDRDCSAAASNGEYSIANNGAANYRAYIDAIKRQLTAATDITFVLVYEPDSLANLVTNLGVQKCANAQSTYLSLTQYGLQQLNLPNVAIYLDAGHAGWLGWQANLTPAAQLFASVFKNAGSPAAVRGLATNVANYNAWSVAACPSYTQGNSNCDEQRYINALAPMLSSQGFNAHFIVDQGRSGKQPTGQQQWGDWCNAVGTGFGTRPTTNTGSSLVDAIVWVKPGGEGDGTSNSTAPRFDFHCAQSDALQPAPQAGTWFEAYFEQLLANANPPLA